MSTTETLVLVLIFALAGLLAAAPLMLGRRERRRAHDEHDIEHVEQEVGRVDHVDVLEAIAAPLPDLEAGLDADLEAPARRRLRDRLGRTRAAFSGVTALVRGRATLDDAAWEELEEALLLADVGLAMTERLVDAVRTRAADLRIADASQLPEMLAAEIAAVLGGDGSDRSLRTVPGTTTVWLIVGVNGVGKTTTVAKLAATELAAGHSVLLAAADTFRAAAADQLAHWAERLGVDVIRGQEGGDPGAVAFDAAQAGRARGIDLVLVDTAGRLHTKVNLMAELEKIRRVLERTPGTVQEVLLVLDASTGQNGLTQAREFTESVGVTGVVLTKLDGSAKGGIVLAIEDELGVPVKLIGIGEGLDDLVTFEADDFAAALVGEG